MQRLELLQDRLLLAQGPFAAQPVDRLVPGDAGDPCARVRRYAVARPALQGDEERLLNGLLGRLEVAQDANEGGDRPSRLVPEQTVDNSYGLLYRVASPGCTYPNCE
jgi:hypothetical protein